MGSGAAGLLRTLGAVSGGVLRRKRPDAERLRHEQTLRSAAAVLTKTGDDFLPAVVAEIASSLGAELTFVGEILGDTRVQTIAVRRRGQPADNFAYPLRDSPTSQQTGAPFCYPDDVRAQFPNDPHLAAVSARGCVGVVLTGTRQEPIGVIVAATARPIEDQLEATALLTLFAGRVAAEMQHARTERELRKNEEHLLQVQRVEAIGRLAGGIAHDFNNLLMIMIGYAEILRDRDGASPEVTELLAAATRATTLTRQLLAFGRRQLLQTQRLDINKVVSQVQTMLTPVIGVHIRLATMLEETLPQVEADPGQIEQVLVNLALNARDAMPGGGTLRLETRVEQLDQPYYQMPPGRYVCLSVSDTGVGMTPDVQAHIFEPFYTTKGSSGTGLGLSSVYGIVKQSGGFIWCQSEPGRGTTFRIYLQPAACQPAATPVPETTLEPATTGTERILVVDDEPGVRRLLTRLLRARGYTVHEAGDGAEALAVLADPSTGIDLVVTDVVMPSMDGIRLAAEIEGRWPSVKLLFVTGHAQGRTLQSSALTSRIPVLDKPFAPARMAAAVRDVLDGPHPPARAHVAG